jgi:hypothetical protein
MTNEQARALIAQIQQETAQIDTSLVHLHNNSAYGWSVRLLCKPAQLVLFASFAEDWPSIKAAWLDWLPGVTLDDLTSPRTRKRHPYRLVDSIPMAIYQLKNGYWCGRATKDHGGVRRYFGKSDPRGLYPLVEKEEMTL